MLGQRDFDLFKLDKRKKPEVIPVGSRDAISMGAEIPGRIHCSASLCSQQYTFQACCSKRSSTGKFIHRGLQSGWCSIPYRVHRRHRSFSAHTCWRCISAIPDVTEHPISAREPTNAISAAKHLQHTSY